ncbi:MAG: hypothetical protein AAGJ86_03055 [Pseudomonadota bacterium]
MTKTPSFAVKSAFAALFVAALIPADVLAEGTIAGTDIDNTASVSYDIGGTPVTQSSNTVTITVAETLNVVAVLQSPQVAVSPGDTNAPLVFTVTNTGNGPETFTLAVDNTDAADDFDPVAATPFAFFDSDDSGDLTPADEAYVPGTNDPLLDADQSVTVIVVNDIPAGLANGDIGRSALTATANTGSGTPGTVIPGAGTNGVDAVIGSTGATASASGEYIVSDVAVAFNKSATVSDPNGGDQPVPGATISYQITLEVSGTGTATALVVNDPIPTNTTYVPDSLTLNGVALTDAADGDVGQFDDAGTPSITVTLGDIAAADGLQTIGFEVLID